MLPAYIISIGNELLIGDTVNTNAAWISRFLTEKGIRVVEIRTIRDRYEEIRRALEEAMEQAKLVVTTGGLGPTQDDITKKAVASFFGHPLVENEEVMDFNMMKLRKQGLPFTDAVREQATIPEGSEVLFNTLGTAPGLWLSRNGSWLAMLPGVPHEMRHVMETGVSRKIDENFSGLEHRVTRYLRTAGIPESILSEKIVGNLDEFTDNGCEVAWLPGPSGVTIRVTGTGDNRRSAAEHLAPLIDHIQNRVGGLIYGEGRDLRLMEATGELLQKRGLKVATAESCTGGLLGDEITDIPGCSRFFQGGIIAYDNEVKVNLLGVQMQTIQRHGAVSNEVAMEMAKGAAVRLGADIGLSTTGVAGPGGGSVEKPVGTVHTGIWMKEKQFVLKAQLTGDRLINKKRSVMIVVESLRRHLLGIETFPYDLKPWTP